MVAKILPVVALAGAAMAACPISVEITDTTDHIAQVAVTNTGSEAITVFKGNTVLSDHPTKDLVISDAEGNQLPFEGVYINYKRTGLDAEAFQTIQPGETVTASVNAAKSYKLAGVETAEITAIQGFKYVTGTTAPTTLKGSLECDNVNSSTVAITPDQSTVASEHISKREASPSSRIKKRSVTYHSCSTSQTSSLQTSFSHAISMSSASSTAAGSALYYFTTWFKSTSVTSTVQSIYNKVAGVQSTSPLVYCTDLYGYCSDGSALLYTVPDDNTIVPCPSNGFWGFPEYATTCADDDYDRAGSILHEATHLYGTDDWAYGQTAAKQLTAARAANNADTYEIYAGSVRLGGCSS